MDTISSSSIRFQSFLHDLGVLFSESWNLYKLKRANLISAAAQFCRKSELFGPPFCISILKVLWTQIHFHLSDFNASDWFRSTFLRDLKFLQIKNVRPSLWGEPIFQKVWIIWSPLLCFTFKSFIDPNPTLFITNQCSLHDSGVIFSESWNFYKLKRGDLISWGNQFCRKF